MGFKPQPPQHGQVKVGGHSPMTPQFMRQTLAAHEDHANQTKDYGGHGIGYSGEGAMAQGGASGSDYQTTSVGDTPAPDSMGPTGY
jgi:hypothetical protein